MTAKQMRQSTLSTLGLGEVIDIFKKGKMPTTASEMVDKVFGLSFNRGPLVISGANGIVGAGKTMQLGSRLQPLGVPIVALDFAGSPDGLGRQFQGLKGNFGTERAAKIMENITSLSYDGKNLPKALKDMKPRFLLEAIPEILEVKKAHYELFKSEFPKIEIRSVTSGFPAKQLGVGVFHPAFPHHINKVWEVVEDSPSDITRMLWALGMVPVPVSDDWSFVLDVLFCGLLSAGTHYSESSNMPYWKVDKYIRRLLGPNPFRAHDAIGAKGANFLTWSCLHHLGKEYGELYRPSADLCARKDSGQNWYPLNHFRPLVDWSLDDHGEREFERAILGPLFQMTSMMLSEKRAHLTMLNAMGELCAQFRSGMLSVIRRYGSDRVLSIVNNFHQHAPEEIANSGWYPAAFENMDSHQWQQLYVNAECDSSVGVISISRESYNHDVDSELNRAIDWLKEEGIERVILTSDFHLSSQMVGAETSDFYPAVESRDAGFNLSLRWSTTARRLESEFEISVGYIAGKRCLGGMLELMSHCHYLIAPKGVALGMPEVTLPVIPGMEGCHWMFRKSDPTMWPHLLELLLTGNNIQAQDAIGLLVDFSDTTEKSLQAAWRVATDGAHGLPRREVKQEGLTSIPDVALLPYEGPQVDQVRRALFNCIRSCCEATLEQALEMQSGHSADFMKSKLFKQGKIGSEYQKTVLI